MIYTLYTLIAVFIALQLDRGVSLVMGSWALRKLKAEREKHLRQGMEQYMLEQSLENIRNGKTLPN